MWSSVLLVAQMVLLAYAAPVYTLTRSAREECRQYRLTDGSALGPRSQAQCEILLSHPQAGEWIQSGGLPSRQELEAILDESRRHLSIERSLADEVCEALLDPTSTVNVISNNEPVGIDYEGNGLLDGINVDVNPSLLSGIFQTATKSSIHPTAAPTTTQRHRQTFQERTKSIAVASSASVAAKAARATQGIKYEGQGLLDGIDVSVAVNGLRDLVDESKRDEKDESCEA